jgi:hypothetical protein
MRNQRLARNLPIGLSKLGQGVRRVVTPQNAAMADFARRLRPGDEVDMTYAEAVAVSVERADR